MHDSIPQCAPSACTFKPVIPVTMWPGSHQVATKVFSSEFCFNQFKASFQLSLTSNPVEKLENCKLSEKCVKIPYPIKPKSTAAPRIDIRFLEISSLLFGDL